MKGCIRESGKVYDRKVNDSGATEAANSDFLLSTLQVCRHGALSCRDCARSTFWTLYFRVAKDASRGKTKL